MARNFKDRIDALRLIDGELNRLRRIARNELSDIKYSALGLSDLIRNLGDECTLEDFIISLKTIVAHEFIVTKNLLKRVDKNDDLSTF